jgi:hypothetical protein
MVKKNTSGFDLSTREQEPSSSCTHMYEWTSLALQDECPVLNTEIFTFATSANVNAKGQYFKSVVDANVDNV